MYHSELLAVRVLLPRQGLGLEIGVGTGRFAGPLGIKVGVDPSNAMITYAVGRRILGGQGIAEALAFKNAVFNFALVVTTICFVDDPKAMLTEARRVLKPGAPLVIGFVDRDRALASTTWIIRRKTYFTVGQHSIQLRKWKCSSGKRDLLTKLWGKPCRNR